VSVTSFKPGPRCLEKKIYSADEDRNRKNNQRDLHGNELESFSAVALEQNVPLVLVTPRVQAALARNQ
jgi:hypothetical protein